MLKNFKRAVLCLAVAGTGMACTSCDSDTVQQIINVIITNLTNLRGTTYNYEGKGTMQLLQLTEDGYEYASEELGFNGTIPMTFNNGLTSISIPAFILGNAKMSEVRFDNLVLKAEKDCTTFDLGESTTANGTLTIGDKVYNVGNLYVDGSVNGVDGTVTSDRLTITTMSIYFGENDEYAVNVTFSGKVPAEQ